MQAHRLYRVLAEQLEQAGFTVLRFDYSGTGDSSGGQEVARITAWLEDIQTAAAELARAAPGTRLAVVGVRLGATLAALASARAMLRVRHLVLWDPVIDGLAYLRDLATVHRAFMAAEFSDLVRQDNLAVDADGVPAESMGMLLTPEMVAEMRSTNLLQELPNADHVTVISTQDSEPMAQFHRAVAERPGYRWLDMKDSENWNCDAALNAATVPMDIIREIIANLQETNP